MSLHPHIHCLVPAAGYSIQGKWKQIGQEGKYLYPVHQLSDTFKGKFLNSIKRALKKQNGNALPNFRNSIEQAYSTRWVVHCEPSLAKSEHVVRYLGQYTHRVAISNNNIVNITNSDVTFIAKDYKDRAIKKLVSLNGVEFLRRFCQHILPKGFVKTRYYGIYNSTTKKNLDLQFVPVSIEDIEKKLKPKETAQQVIMRVTGYNVCQCPFCKKGTMRKIKELPRIRSPSNNLPNLLLLKLQ